MFPASSKGGGQCMAFPDVCKTPAPPAPFVPIPYPNISMVMQASGTASKVKICGKDAVTKSSSVSRSQGDATLQADVGVRFARWSIGASAATMNLNPGPGPVRELGLYAGRALLTTQDWSLNGSLAAWRYGGRIPGLDYDYDEARLQLAWRARLRLDLAWSPNYSIGTRLGVAREADSYETALTLVQPVSRSLALSAGIGRFAIGGALDRGFWYWSAGATLTGERLSAALAWTGSEAVTRDMFSSRSADDRLVATVSLRLH